MKRIGLAFGLMLFLTGTATSQTCKVKFSVVWKDQLNNIRQGLSEKEEKDLKKTITKKYPEICYASPAAGLPVVFFISISSEQYETSERVRTSGTVTDPDGNASGTTEATTTVPVQRTRPVFTLSIETPQSDGSFKVMHTVREVGCHAGLAGAIVGVQLFAKCRSGQLVIEDAVKWIHAGGLTDSTQTVLTPK